MKQLDAAQRWGCPLPSDFDDASKSDRIDILAWYEARWRIDAVNAYEAQKRAEHEAKRKRGKK